LLVFEPAGADGLKLSSYGELRLRKGLNIVQALIMNEGEGADAGSETRASSGEVNVGLD
jgi:hypothetical protein